MKLPYASKINVAFWPVNVSVISHFSVSNPWVLALKGFNVIMLGSGLFMKVHVGILVAEIGYGSPCVTRGQPFVPVLRIWSPLAIPHKHKSNSSYQPHIW